MKVRFHPAAVQEYWDLPGQEQGAMDNAISKLRALGDGLGFPHTSALKGSHGLRELRPRGGRSRWRAFYRRFGDELMILAIGLDAKADSKGFQGAVSRALDRMSQLED